MNIDRIAREMVDIEPSRDLEAMIRARIREARPAQTAAWWTWRLSVPLGALAAIALIIVVQVSRSVPAGVQRSADLPAATAPAGPVTEANAVAQGGSQVAVVRTPQRSATASLQSSKAAPQLTAEELAWMERRMPALDPLNALHVDQLRVDSIQPEPLAITPLTMTPVATDSGAIERRNDR